MALKKPITELEKLLAENTVPVVLWPQIANQFYTPTQSPIWWTHEGVVYVTLANDLQLDLWVGRRAQGDELKMIREAFGLKSNGPQELDEWAPVSAHFEHINTSNDITLQAKSRTLNTNGITHVEFACKACSTSLNVLFVKKRECRDGNKLECEISLILTDARLICTIELAQNTQAGLRTFPEENVPPLKYNI